MGPRARATSVRTYYAFFAMQLQARADRAMAMAEAKSRGTAAELSEMWAYVCYANYPDRTGDLQIFSLALSQLSYRYPSGIQGSNPRALSDHHL